jgi:hypothetical protein
VHKRILALLVGLFAAEQVGNNLNDNFRGFTKFPDEVRAMFLGLPVFVNFDIQA